MIYEILRITLCCHSKTFMLIFGPEFDLIYHLLYTCNKLQGIVFACVNLTPHYKECDVMWEVSHAKSHRRVRVSYLIWYEFYVQKYYCMAILKLLINDSKEVKN